MDREMAEDQPVLEYEIPEDESVSVATVRAVCSLRECDPTALTPLYETIDPDALDELSESRDGGEFRVEFVFGGYQITVDGGGDRLVLRPEAE